MFRRLFSRINRQYIAEIAVIIVFALLATKEFQNFDTSYRLAGQEAEWLTSSALLAADSFQSTGRLPWWQPLLGRGQPAIDESFSFILNPFSIIPSLIYGGVNGIKVSVIVYFVLVGIGGWFLGWALGWRTLARMLMALLLITKGNMQSVIGMGFFQLGVSQAYFPWVLAGALTIPRFVNQRWPIVLLALSLALLFFAGNIYFMLPAALIVLIVAAFYAIRFQRQPLSVNVDSHLLKRYGGALLLAGGIMAISALTILVNFPLMGRHPDHEVWLTFDLVDGLAQFVHPEVLQRGLWTENAYTYVAPLWFVVLFLILLFPIPLAHRSAGGKSDNRLWWIGLIGLILFASWGMGLNPIIKWMYANLPLIGQWRTPERMLTLASFFLVFLLAFRLDGLYRAAVLINYKRTNIGRLTKALVGASLFVAAGAAVLEVTQSRNIYGALWYEDKNVDRCMVSLRKQNLYDFLSVRRRDYVAIAQLLRNDIRMEHVGADYDLGGVSPTIYPYDLTDVYPPYYSLAWDDSTQWLAMEGFTPVPGIATIAPDIETACVWQKADALSYAFSASLLEMTFAPEPLPVEITTPVTLLGRTREHIALEAYPSPDEETVVVAQDTAYPGWTVRVNGEAAKLESVGQLIGVILPPGSEPQLVEFIYTAPTLRLGGWISLFTSLFCIGYLLQLDPLAKRFALWWKARQQEDSQTPTAFPSPIPRLPSIPALRRPKPAPSVTAAQPQAISQSLPAMPVIMESAHADASQDYPLRPESNAKQIRIMLPPSDVPYQIELVQPSNSIRVNGMWAVITASIALLLLLLARQPRKD